MAKRMRRALRATKPQERVLRARAFEVIDRNGRPIGRLGPTLGSDVGEPGVGLVLYGPDGSQRLTVTVDTAGPAIHLSQNGTVRCSIAVIDADEAWWPPTFTPSGLGRRWLALWIIQQASHSALRVSSSSSAILRAETALPSMQPILFPPSNSGLSGVAVSAYLGHNPCHGRKFYPDQEPKMAESAKIELTALDRRILKVLQEDGRMTIQAVADRVGLSASPCLRRIRRMEQAGIITAYSITVDQNAVGLPVSVFVSIKLERQRAAQLDRFAAAIAGWPEVMECYLMTGQFDFLLRVVCADLSAYEAFLREKLTQLDGVGSIESSFALGQVKYSRVLPI